MRALLARRLRQPSLLLRSFVAAHTRTTASGKQVQVAPFYTERAPAKKTQAAQAARGYEPEHAEAYIRAHKPALDDTLAAMQKHMGHLGEVHGRLKLSASLLGKLAKKKAEGRTYPIERVEDVAGTRLTVPSIQHAREAAEAIRKHFKVTSEENYNTDAGHPTGSGYRSHHFIVESHGRPVEMQVRTPNQTKWADWAHDRIYKGTLKDDPAVGSYAKEVSAHYWQKEHGHASQAPPCPPPLQKEGLCID